LPDVLIERTLISLQQFDGGIAIAFITIFSDKKRIIHRGLIFNNGKGSLLLPKNKIISS
jgi:hypothetical protein